MFDKQPTLKTDTWEKFFRLSAEPIKFSLDSFKALQLKAQSNFVEEW